MKQKKLEQIRQRKKKKITKKQPKWLFPNSIEREYNRDLLSLTKQLRELIKGYLLPEIPSMIYETKIKTPNDRQDDFLDRLKSIIIFIRSAMQNKVEQTITKAESVSTQVSNYNRVQFQKVNESVFGINLFVDEPWLSDQLNLFASQNAKLITSLPEQELERVSGIVERGLQEGKTYTDVQAEIKKTFGISDRKARLIARDQTAKLNGSLTRLRQESIGVKEYRWQTSGDERVRNSHAVLDGKLCKWDDPTVYLDEKDGKWKKRSSIGAEKLHPRRASNCRCEAIPE